MFLATSDGEDSERGEWTLHDAYIHQHERRFSRLLHVVVFPSYLEGRISGIENRGHDANGRRKVALQRSC